MSDPAQYYRISLESVLVTGPIVPRIYYLYRHFIKTDVKCYTYDQKHYFENEYDFPKLQLSDSKAKVNIGLQ